MLFPALNSARASARSTQSLSNVRQIGSIGLQSFLADHNEFPWHSSVLSSQYQPDGKTKPRWADYLFPYVPSTDAFISPMLDLSGASKRAILGKHFWHEVSKDHALRIAQLAFVNDGYADVQWICILKASRRRAYGVECLF